MTNQVAELPEIDEPVRVGSVAHGGHCVARHDGRVLFVRHTLPGELVRVRVTDDTHHRFWRADAVEILEPSPDRVKAPCEVSGPGGCGGCDWQHVSASGQLELKRSVVAEQLSRMAGIEWDGQVEQLEPLFGWRTRMRYVATGEPSAYGLGLRAHRSDAIIPLPEAGCLLAAQQPPIIEGESGDELTVVDAFSGRVAVADGELLEGDDVRVQEKALERIFDVEADGFWQIHPKAAETLAAAVIEGLKPKQGERAFDLYCGVGLFAAALAQKGVTVWGVESSKPAISNARRNVREAKFSSGKVERVMDKLPLKTDLVVVDPPRTGVGRKVLQMITERTPRALAYVACDPAALGRDLAYAQEMGWKVESIRAFDLFPQTHHIECVVILIR